MRLVGITVVDVDLVETMAEVEFGLTAGVAHMTFWGDLRVQRRYR